MTRADPGLQPERTELAWRRTALAIALGSIVSLRLVPDALGSAWWMIPGFVGIVGAGVLWTLSRRRYLETESAFTTADPRAVPDGALILAGAVFTTVIGILCVVVVVAAAAR